MRNLYPTENKEKFRENLLELISDSYDSGKLDVRGSKGIYSIVVDRDNFNEVILMFIDERYDTSGLEEKGYKVRRKALVHMVDGEPKLNSLNKMLSFKLGDSIPIVQLKEFENQRGYIATLYL